MRAILAIAICAALFGPAAAGIDLTLTGYARVIDGDGLEIEGAPIRLAGIDAVEKAQTCWGASGAEWPCGQAASHYLSSMTAGRMVECQASGRDRYKRWLAVCWLLPDSPYDAGAAPRAEALNLNLAMVAAGFAVAYYDKAGVYAAPEAQARQDRRGVWAGSFIAPREWRRLHKGHIRWLEREPII